MSLAVMLGKPLSVLQHEMLKPNAGSRRGFDKARFLAKVHQKFGTSARESTVNNHANNGTNNNQAITADAWSLCASVVCQQLCNVAQLHMRDECNSITVRFIYSESP